MDLTLKQGTRLVHVCVAKNHVTCLLVLVMLKECLFLVLMFLLLCDLWMYFLCYANFLNNSLYCLFLVNFSAPFLVC